MSLRSPQERFYSFTVSNQMKLQVVLLVIVTGSFLSSVNCQECYPVIDTPPCVCETFDGKIIDLRGIARYDGTA